MTAASTACTDALGLDRIPFPTTPDAACYFPIPWLGQDLAEAIHCLQAHKGFVLVTGEIGLGKSTFVRRLADIISKDACSLALVLNTFLDGADLLRSINADFGIGPGRDFADDLARLNAFLVAQHAENRTAVIIVDDAQNLSVESLELIRMLSNIETSQEKLVQILLCGQPELVDKLALPAIRQLASRIVKHIELRPLRAAEARDYVAFRLASAGAGPDLGISPAARRALQRHSAGNPRHVHLILDRCLYGLVARHERQITPALVHRAAAESGMRRRHQRMQRKALRWALGGAIACVASVVTAAMLTRPVAEVINQGSAQLAAHAPAARAPAEAPGRPAAAAASAMAAPPRSACFVHFDLTDRDGHIGAALHAGDARAAATEIAGQRPDVAVFAVPAHLATGVLPPSACVLRDTAPRVLAWQLPAALDGFELGSRHASIRVLQSRLAARGLYRYRLDGTVGPRTVAAIASFQRQHQLAATGYPDAVTRFILAREAASTASLPPQPER